MTELDSKIKRLHDLTRLILDTIERSGYSIEECTAAIHILHALLVSYLPDRRRREITELVERTAQILKSTRLGEKHRVIGS